MSFLENPIGNISGALHKIDQSPIGKALEGAALMYFGGGPTGFLGEAGLGGLTGLGAATNAGLLVGGITGLSSGNLAQGLMAGLSAGAGAGMFGAPGSAPTLEAPPASSTVPSAPTTPGANIAPTNVSQFTVPSSISDTELGQAGLDRTYSTIPEATPTTPMPRDFDFPQSPSAPPSGIEQVAKGAADKTSLYQDLKNKFMGLSTPAQLAVGLGGLGLLKESMKPQPLNAPKQANTQNYRYYNYSPFGGYSGQGVTPVTGATGGIVALAHGGGVHHYDDGGTIIGYYEDGSPQYADVPTAPAAPAPVAAAPVADVAPAAPQYTSYTPQQMHDYIQANQIVTGDPAQLAAAEAATHADPAAVDAYLASIHPTASFFAPGGVGSQIATLEGQGISGAVAAPQAMFLNDLKNTPNASDAAYYNDLVRLGVTPDSQAGTNIAKQVGLTQADFADRYNLAKDVSAEGNVVGQYQGPGTPATNLGSSFDQTWAAFMDAHKDASGAVDPITVQEIARTTGIPLSEIQARYAAAEAKLHPSNPPPPPIVKPTTTTSTTGTTGTTGTTSTTGTTGTTGVTPGGTQLPTATTYVSPTGIAQGFGNYGSGNQTGTDYLGRTVSTATPGDIITNQDNTRTDVSNTPGRPYGGYTGIDALKSAYTAGGGSLGYVNPAPKTMAEFTAKYDTQTGGSKAAYDYLMGKSPYPINPTTPTGEIAKPYQSSVMGMPVNPKYTVSQPYIFDPATKTYKSNPAFDPNFSATKDYLQVPQSGLTNTNATKALGYTALPNGIMAYPNPDGTFTGADGKTYDATGKVVGALTNDSATTGVNNPNINGANGGLMSLATGGVTIGHLGGYSDGGRLLRGPGDGVSDSIPATIGAHDPEPARLADGEFVVPARIVSELGNGSTEAGARQLYKMMDRIQHARRKTIGKEKVATNTHAAKYLPA